MVRSSLLGRVALAGALLFSALAVGVAPAGAAGAPTGSATSTNDGTATITYSDTTDLEIYIIDGAGTCENTGAAPATGVLATMGVVEPVPASPVTVTTATQVGPAPLRELGTGSFLFCMYDVVGGSYTYLNEENGTIGIFPPASASLVDNGNGTLTLTWVADSDFSQYVYLFLLSGITTCPADPTTEVLSLTGYGLQSDGESFGAGIPPSPAIIGAGIPAIVFPWVPVDYTPPTAAPMTAGQYLACAYTSADEGPVLAQSLPIGLGIVPEPVVPPAFTG